MNELIFNRKSINNYLLAIIVGLLSAPVFTSKYLAFNNIDNWSTLIPQGIAIFLACEYVCTIRRSYNFIVIRNYELQAFVALVIFNVFIFSFNYGTIFLVSFCLGAKLGTGLVVKLTLLIILGKYLILLIDSVLIALLFNSQKIWVIITLVIAITYFYHYYVKRLIFGVQFINLILKG